MGGIGAEGEGTGREGEEGETEWKRETHQAMALLAVDRLLGQVHGQRAGSRGPKQIGGWLHKRALVTSLGGRGGQAVSARVCHLRHRRAD